MSNKKLKLSEVRIKSFVTAFDEKTTITVKGGKEPGFSCGHYPTNCKTGDWPSYNP